jgi:single-stranded DNA-specific DHH superfamily exonuclease
MDFYYSLQQLNKMDMLDIPSYSSPYLSTEDKVIDALEDVVKNNRRTLLYGDYDPDGAVCIQIIIETFERLEFKNYEIFHYSNRTHSIDSSAELKAKTGYFEVMIICDAGSQSPAVINRLNLMGVKTILIDHHESVFSYSDFEGAMVNTTFENRTNTEELTLSAGALTYVICEKLLRKLKTPEPRGLAALALCSMYADCVDMSSKLGRSLYYKAMEDSQLRLPTMVQHLMNDYSVFSRRFIEFQMTPKINSLFRSENFDLLNKFLYWRPGIGVTPMYEIVEQIDQVWTKSRESVKKATDLIEHEVLNNFVLGNLSSVARSLDIPEDKLHNYTGLVANKLGDQYGKTAIVYADSGSNIKASLRDQHGRNYLELFQQFCDCGGHNSAFGIHVDYREFPNFRDYIKLIDSQFFIKSVGNAPILVPHNVNNPNSVMIQDMCRYNEFAGVHSPFALLTKIWVNNGKAPITTRYGGKQYMWGSSFRIESKTLLRDGLTVHIKPYQAKKPRLEVVDIK